MTATRTSQAERDSYLVFRYNPKSKNPKTGMHTVHTWFSDTQTRCVCGRFHRDDKRLVTVKREDLHTVFGLFCKRCTWHDSDAERRLNTREPNE